MHFISSFCFRKHFNNPSLCRYLHDAEYDSLVKFAYKLSFKAHNPSTFERQNVKFALEIFNNFTAQALTIPGEKH